MLTSSQREVNAPGGDLSTAARRRLLQPSPVTGGVPRWFWRELQQLRRHDGGGDRRLNLLGWARSRFGRWFDHTGQAEIWGQRVFVAEPYASSLSPGDFARIAEFATAIGCEWRLFANSWHVPGETLRIAFFARDSEADLPGPAVSAS